MLVAEEELRGSKWKEERGVREKSLMCKSIAYCAKLYAGTDNLDNDIIIKLKIIY